MHASKAFMLNAANTGREKLTRHIVVKSSTSFFIKIVPLGSANIQLQYNAANCLVKFCDNQKTSAMLWSLTQINVLLYKVRDVFPLI
jgi:hypothetical protein